ncbi:hypothetical protein F383_00692 [Gossypium arboreum]|uniref:Uncharacterized protein n=1 Tax=Gossypium arboreum TaxID=29729 RepID=A0A0B0PCW8_GOSAR|nr:hypothetical protein F383_00692 [Gossypium arboreum]
MFGTWHRHCCMSQCKTMFGIWHRHYSSIRPCLGHGINTDI